jgi:hypothetical protein
MKAPLALAALALALLAPLARAAGEADDPPATGRKSEPHVQHTVIEDDGSRIEELRVRGQTQRLSVTPKGAINKPYEIVPADGAKDPPASGQATHGSAAGQRVWNVLSF